VKERGSRKKESKGRENREEERGREKNAIFTFSLNIFSPQRSSYLRGDWRVKESARVLYDRSTHSRKGRRSVETSWKTLKVKKKEKRKKERKEKKRKKRSKEKERMKEKERKKSSRYLPMS
jgi:hypothetical protein